MPATNLILLPGVDGTGKLFCDFIDALAPSLVAKPIKYPSDKFLSYAELLSFLHANMPESQPFVLLAESFSTPLAIRYAATAPGNLRALVLCAGFVTNPVGRLAPVAVAAAPCLFNLKPPDIIIEHFLAGPNAPAALLSKIRGILDNVDARVIRARVREIFSCDARTELSNVAVPTMHLRPSDDRLISMDAIDKIRLAKPDILFKSIRGPHMILQREPRASASIISEFVQQLNS